MREPMLDAVELRRLGRVATEPRAELGDAHAAAHYRVFVHEAMPVASIYLSPDGMMNPDGHVSGLLKRAAELQNAAIFLQQYVASWLPLQTAAVRRMAADEETVRWADDMDEVLRAARTEHTEAVPDLPPVVDILEDPKTTLARIGRHLAVPAQCGLFLTHTDIQQAARTFRVPTGFGSRARSVEGLLRGASTYDALEDVCAVLVCHVDETKKRWPEFVGAEWQQAWNERLAATRLLLERLVTTVARG